MKRLPPAWVVRPLLAVRNGLGRAHAAFGPPQLPLLERIFGVADTKAIAVVAELGIADLVADAPATAAELAARCEVDADALDRVLRFLVSRQVFTCDRRGRYRNNGMSKLLRSDADGTQREWARMVGSRWHVDVWNHLEHSVRTGEAAALPAFGRPFWEQLTEHDPDAGAQFDRAMEDMSSLQTTLIPGLHDFSRCREVCDVGGGTGTVLAGILRACPEVRGVLLDLPAVVAKASPVLEAAGVADRVRVVPGDFFASLPEGCDRYLLQAIVHDWDDDSCVTILGNVRQAMAQRARVLVFEQELPNHRGAHPAKITDLEMLVDTGAGRERTRTEFEALFTRAGFRVARAKRLPIMTVFELVPA